MRKRLLAAALALLLLFGAASCKKEKPGARLVLEKLLEELNVDVQSCTLYRLDDLTQSPESAEFFSSLYRRAPLGLHLDAAKDFAAALSRKDDGFEIEIFISKHPSGAAELRELFERRITLMRAGGVRSYLFEDYDQYLSSVQIYEKGNYVVLLATGQNDRAVKALDRLL